MQPRSKLVSHDLQLPDQLLAKVTNKKGEMLSHSSSTLTKVQSSRLNKYKTVLMAQNFLEDFLQEAQVQDAFDSANKKDDMADALLQALAYANSVMQISNSATEATSAGLEQEASSFPRSVIILE